MAHSWAQKCTNLGPNYHWENRSTSGFFHRYLVNWHSLVRVERSVKPVVTGNHSIVQVESAKRISLHHAMRQCTTSQRSRSYLRQKNCGRRDQCNVGSYSEVWLFCSTVMTTLPFCVLYRHTCELRQSVL